MTDLDRAILLEVIRRLSDYTDDDLRRVWFVKWLIDELVKGLDDDLSI